MSAVYGGSTLWHVPTLIAPTSNTKTTVKGEKDTLGYMRVCSNDGYFNHPRALMTLIGGNQ